MSVKALPTPVGSNTVKVPLISRIDNSIWGASDSKASKKDPKKDSKANKKPKKK